MNLPRPPSATATSNCRFRGMAFRWSRCKLHLPIFCWMSAHTEATRLLVFHTISYRNAYVCALGLFFSIWNFLSFLLSLLTVYPRRSLMCSYLRKAVLKLFAPFVYFHRIPLYSVDFILTSARVRCSLHVCHASQTVRSSQWRNWSYRVLDLSWV